MSNRVTTIFGAVVVVAVVGVVIWAIVRGVEAEPSVVGSLATAASAVIAVVWSRSREQQAQLAQTHREQMAPIYEQLFMHVTQLVDGNEASPEQLEFYRDLHRKLLFYGPTPVVQAWLTWTRGELPTDGDDPTAMLRFEQVLFAIRADLGHDNSGLAPGDLLRIYITDIDEALAAHAAT